MNPYSPCSAVVVSGGDRAFIIARFGRLHRQSIGCQRPSDPYALFSWALKTTVPPTPPRQDFLSPSALSAAATPRFCVSSMAVLFPLHRLWLLPLISGVTWFITLFVLLITWIAKGTPKYPGQSNPDIAFISDIAAFMLKPFFLIGATITAFAFIGTVCSVHFARYDHRMYGIDDIWFKKHISILAMVSGVVAGAGLILLAVMDTFRFHQEHHILLLICFSGLGLSALSTTVVYYDQTVKPSKFRELRFYCAFSAFVVLLEVVMGLAFVGLMYTGHMRIAGIFEWILAFLGCFYMLAFVGFVAVPIDNKAEAQERTPLLQESAQVST